MRKVIPLFGILIFIGLDAWGQVPSPKVPLLEAEVSKFQRTGNYAEVESVCQSLEKIYPDWVNCFSMGRSAEGRPIWAMAVSRSGLLKPAPAKRAGIPVVLAIGGTHAGEIDGKDAGLLLLKEWLQKPPVHDPLLHQIFLFVPVFNVDGHEKSSPYNRPNQNGPSVQGDRVTAQRINLNRDWILSQSAEMTAMLQLITQWDPLLTLDLHVTDGVRFRHEVSLSMSPMFGADDALSEVSEQLMSDMIDRIDAKGHHPLNFTPVLLDFEDPRAGIMRDADAPRFSHVYATLRNRIGILVEDHAWSPYAQRVKTCKDVLISALELIAKDGRELLKVTNQADVHAEKMISEAIALDWHNQLEDDINIPTGHIDLLGYEYTTYQDAPIVGGRNIKYHINKPQTWHTPVYTDIQPVNDAIVTLPKGGYLIPAGWVSVVSPYLQKHGVAYQTLNRSLKNLPVQALQVNPDTVSFEPRTFQGRLRTSISGQWIETKTDVLQGSIFVPVKQARALLAVHLLEPVAPDSLSRWGLFNTAYEITDHISNHRQLQIAQWMYDQDWRIRQRYGETLHKNLPNLRKEYQTRMDRDDRFRDDPEQRIEFWMRQIPYHDPSFSRYPILRIDQSPFLQN